MRISDFNAGVATTDESELVLAVQAGLTYKLTLAQANALRQPKSQVLSDLAALDSGVGYPYRDAMGVWALALPPGVGVFDPLGAAATAQANAIAAAAIDATTKANNAQAAAEATAAADATIKASAALGDAIVQDYFTPGIRRVATADSPLIPSNGEYLFLIDASAGNVVFNLAAISALYDRKVFIFKVRALGAFTVTINSNAADDIDGAASVSISSLYQSVTLVATFDAGGDSYWSIL